MSTRRSRGKCTTTAVSLRSSRWTRMTVSERFPSTASSPPIVACWASLRTARESLPTTRKLVTSPARSDCGSRGPSGSSSPLNSKGSGLTLSAYRSMTTLPPAVVATARDSSPASVRESLRSALEPRRMRGVGLDIWASVPSEAGGRPALWRERMTEIVWRPTPDYLERANLTRFMRTHAIGSYEELIRRSQDDIEWFWDAVIQDLGIEFFKPYEAVLDTSDGIPWATWFVGGTINLAHNCVDRWAERTPEAVAVLWEGEDGEVRRVTYRQLREMADRLAHGLEGLGVRERDAVGIFLPMAPETVAATWPAPSSAPSTCRSSPATPPTPWPPDWPMQTPRSSSPPTASCGEVSAWP